MGPRGFSDGPMLDQRWPPHHMNLNGLLGAFIVLVVVMQVPDELHVISVDSSAAELVARLIPKLEIAFLFSGMGLLFFISQIYK